MARAWFANTVIDPNGRPIASATVDVFITGTTTPIAETIYSGPTGVGTLSNPFATNSEGEFQFWLDLPVRVDLRYTKVGYGTESHTVEVLAADHTHAAGSHPDLATHDALGLATDDELDTAVAAAVAALVAAAPGTLDTLNELAGALGDDPAFATTIATSVGLKLAKASNLSDIANAATALANLGGAPIASPTFTGITTAPEFSASGLTGSTAASRYVGATASGAPTTGAHAVGDFVIDQTGKVWICTVAGTPGTWVALQSGASGAFGSPTIGKLKSGLYYSSFAGGHGSGNATLNRLDAIPFWVPEACTLDRIGIRVSGVGGAGSVVRLGFYSDNGDGYPGAVLLDAGTVDSTGTGRPEITISQALTAGLVWVVSAAQVGTIPAVALTGATAAYALGDTASTNITSGSLTAYTQAGVTGALPANFSTSVAAVYVGNNPFVRVA